MKRYVCLLLIAALASCSSDDSSDVQTGVLPKKIIETFAGSDAHTTVYQYNGNKLKSALTSDNDSKIVYTYSGNLITRVSFQELDGTELQRNDFTYDAMQRITRTEARPMGDSHVNSIDYSYNDDGTISSEVRVWDPFELEYWVENRKYFIENGDIVKIETYLSNGTKVNSMLYDVKNNPYKNITGFVKLLDFYVSAHNILANTTTAPDGNVLGQSTTTYTYNEENYPITSLQTGAGNDKTTEYFYE